MKPLTLPQQTRRYFCLGGASALLAPDLLHAQAASSRPDVAAIDHDRILAAAGKALTSPLATGSKDADAVLSFSRQVSALAAAFQLTREEKYAAQAAILLRAWLLDPATCLSPDLKGGDGLQPHFEQVLERLSLAEVAQAIPFLAASEALSPEDLSKLKAWFAASLEWLATSRVAGLARDQKDHHGLSWLLQATAFARLTANEAILRELTHRFKTVTLRAQLVGGGTFPHELTTPYPYRNSLFALDLLAGACLLLSTPFENLWDFELQDGPGMRVAIARHYPYILNRGTWPYRADLDHFTDLPVRNPALLFAARAYTRPEYAALWKTLNPDPSLPELQRTFPISQPLLWVARPRR